VRAVMDIDACEGRKNQYERVLRGRIHNERTGSEAVIQRVFQHTLVEKILKTTETSSLRSKTVTTLKTLRTGRGFKTLFPIINQIDIANTRESHWFRSSVGVSNGHRLLQNEKGKDRFQIPLSISGSLSITFKFWRR
jgi:hypothetical protein